MGARHLSRQRRVPLRVAQSRMRAIRTHRCYRRLSTPLSHIVPCILITLAVEVIVILTAQPLEHLVSRLDASIVAAAHVPVSLGSEKFQWLNLAPLEFTM